jgi:hypothetical protein
MEPLHRSILAVAVGAGLIGGSFGVFAADDPLPAERQGDVAYISGGVGKDEAAAFEDAAAAYPLMLVFVEKAKPRDQFVADVKVDIRDGKGREVLNTTAEGPFLLARLPADTYKVFATYSGQMHERTVKVGTTGHRRVVFEWTA